MIMENLDKGYNLKESAEKLGISVQTLYRLIAAKKIKTFNFGLSKRIRHQEIIDFITKDNS